MGGNTARDQLEATAARSSENGRESPQPERFDLRSHNISEDKLRDLLKLFPEARTEGEKVDFNRIKLALGETVDAGKERYGLTWPGKADCFGAIQTPSIGTLLPAPETSVNWEASENLIIEGDNLEVLKLLQKSYLGKVKMIYIDPPYNTGSDFIYPDNYAESLQTYLEYTGQVDSLGKRFSTNSDTEGRFHSRWLNMMYPRLYLARNLLSDSGVLFVSIDDNELPRLLLLCQEIFGEGSVDVMIWRKTGYGRHGKMKNTSTYRKDHEYILTCFRNEQILAKLVDYPEFVNENAFGNPDNDPRGDWFSGSVSRTEAASNPRHENYFEVRSPAGVVWKRQWEVSRAEFEGLIGENRIYWGEDGRKVPRRKIFQEERRETTPSSILTRGTTTGGTEEAEAIIGPIAAELRPKPTELLESLVQMGSSADDIVLDFFAGSGTTAQAVLRQNEIDGGHRRFVLVQLPEPISEQDGGESRTIADLCRSRVRECIHARWPKSGFRSYELAESNFKVWDSDRPQDTDALQRRLTDHVSHIREGRSETDILTELLLKSGLPTTVNLSEVMVGGKKASKIADSRLVVCLDRHLTLEAIRAMADLKPERVVCLDEGFSGNDQLKVNAAQAFKTKGIMFQTV